MFLCSSILVIFHIKPQRWWHITFFSAVLISPHNKNESKHCGNVVSSSSTGLVVHYQTRNWWEVVFFSSFLTLQCYTATLTKICTPPSQESAVCEHCTVQKTSVVRVWRWLSRSWCPLSNRCFRDGTGQIVGASETGSRQRHFSLPWSAQWIWNTKGDPFIKEHRETGL